MHYILIVCTPFSTLKFYWCADTIIIWIRSDCQTWIYFWEGWGLLQGQRQGQGQRLICGLWNRDQKHTRSHIQKNILTWTRKYDGVVVYCADLKQSRGNSLPVTHRTSDIRVTSDIPVTLGLVQVELSTIISGSHAATYVVNACVS